MNGGDPTAAWSWGDDRNFPEGRPDRLQMTTDSLAGQSLIGHHAALVQDVGAGSVPLQTYSESPTPTLTSTWKKRSRSSSKSPTTSGAPASKRRACERKKGSPWTIEEHMLFLMGMERFGRSDWRSISRNVVVTRNPSQVASHAQKFFNRQKLGAKQRKRSSIHDITTVSDARARLPQTESPSTSAFNMDSIPSIHPSPSTSPATSLNHNYPFAHPSSLHPSTQTHPDAHPFTQPPTMDINIQDLDCLLYEYDHPLSDNSNAMFGVPDQAMFVPGPGPSNQAMFVGGHPNHQAMCVPGPGLGPSNHQAMCVPGPGPSNHQVMCVPGPGPDNKPMFVSGPANQPLYSNYMSSLMR